jgi:hypothetical protein
LAASRCLRVRNLEPAGLAEWVQRCSVLDASTADRDLTADLLLAEVLLTPSDGDPPGPVTD